MISTHKNIMHNIHYNYSDLLTHRHNFEIMIIYEVIQVNEGDRVEPCVVWLLSTKQVLSPFWKGDKMCWKVIKGDKRWSSVLLDCMRAYQHLQCLPCSCQGLFFASHFPNSTNRTWGNFTLSIVQKLRTNNEIVCVKSVSDIRHVRHIISTHLDIISAHQKHDQHTHVT